MDQGQMKFVPRLKGASLGRNVIPRICAVTKQKKHDERIFAKSLVKLPYSDPSQLLHLINSFHNHRAAGVERKLNKYLKSLLHADYVFVVSFLKDEAQVRVKGNEKYKYIQVFHVSAKVISALVDRCKKFSGLLGQLDDSIQAIFRDIVKDDKCDIVSVPFVISDETEISLILMVVVNPRVDDMMIAKAVNETIRFCMPSLRTAILCDMEVQRSIFYKKFLAGMLVAYEVFGDLDALVKTVLDEAIKITNSTHGTIFLMEFLGGKNNWRIYSTIKLKLKYIDLNIYPGIAGQTARTGKPIIVKRSEADKIEQLPGITVKSMFSFPIYSNKKMLLVVQLYNKRGGDYTLHDIHCGKSFTYCFGTIVEQSIVYNWTMRQHRQDQMARRMITNYVNFDDAATIRLLNCPHGQPDFDLFEFEPRDMRTADTATWAMKIFENLGLLKAFNIDRKDFAMFILHIKMGYLGLPYHNWTLGFCTLHFTYLVIMKLKLIKRNVLSEIEAFTLLVVAMARYIDFRGHTNIRMLKQGCDLVNMYTSSGNIMEYHQLTQVLHILVLEQCNILKRMSKHLCIQFLEMLACTMTPIDTKYKPFVVDLQQIFQIDIYNMAVIPARVKSQLMQLILKTAMLSDFLRTFSRSLVAFKLIHQEIMQGGTYLNIPHNEKPKKRKQRLHVIHRFFFKMVCKPIVFSLEQLLPDMPKLHEELYVVKTYWKYSRHIFLQTVTNDVTSLDVMNSTMFDDEVYAGVQIPEMRSDIGSIMTFQTFLTTDGDDDTLSYAPTDDGDDDDDVHLLAALDDDSEESLLL